MRILATFWLSGMIAFCLLLTPLSTAQHKPAPALIAITHATVINPGTSSVQANRTIVITSDHITSVSDTPATRRNFLGWKPTLVRSKLAKSLT